MRLIVLSFPSDIFARLSEHLETPEQVAFMLATPDSDDGIYRVTVIRTFETGGSALRTSAEYEDSIRTEVIKWATLTEDCLVEAHSHGHWFSPVCFSPFDIDQLHEWVPHVRWRLGGRPYFALVTAASEVDGLAWIDDGPPTAIDTVLVDGQDDLPTTRESIARLKE